MSFALGLLVGYLVGGGFVVLWAISAGVWARMVEYIQQTDDVAKSAHKKSTDTDQKVKE